jgi:tRNA wybutosine-synthesizing protein 1
MLPVLNNHVEKAKTSNWYPNWLKRKIEIVERAGYRVIGPNKHSAVKVCHYTKQDIRDKDYCYKCKFYGISSARCLQLSVTNFVCSFNCTFCWRNLGYIMPPENFIWDKPDIIMEEAIKAQQNLLQGFWGSESSNKEKLKKAMEPKHVALSLSGETCLYPYLPELIDNIIIKRKMTAYLVTNGAHPDMIRNLISHQPTNLYISLYGTDEETYAKTCTPNIPNPFPKVKESLSLMKHFECRTVMRLTMTKDFNFKDPIEYAKLARFAQPQCVEVKAYMNVGGAQARLTAENMPEHEEIIKFSETLAEHSGYKIMDQKENSRVVLLQRSDMNLKPEEVMSDDAYKM